MKLLLAEIFVSAVYVFDVSTYPFIHVSFYLLTLLYFASILEVYGLFRVARSISRRLERFQHRHRTSVLIRLGRFLPPSRLP